MPVKSLSTACVLGCFQCARRSDVLHRCSGVLHVLLLQWFFSREKNCSIQDRDMFATLCDVRNC